MSFYDIGQELYDVLDTVKTGGTRLAAIYNYQIASTEVEAFPYAYVAPGPSEEKELDTASNQALYNYTIRATDVYTDKAATEVTMRQLADDILSELRKRVNQNLGGLADRVHFNTQFYSDTGNGSPVRYFEISVEVMRNFSIDL